MEKPAPHVRRLKELLEEKQEPFLLDVYLLENGHSKKSLEFKGDSSCWTADDCKNLQSFSRCNTVKMRRREKPNYSKLLKSVILKLVSSAKSAQRASSDVGKRDNGRSSDVSGCVVDREIGESVVLDRISSESSSTVFDSCIDSDNDDSLSTCNGGDSLSAMVPFGALKLTNLRKTEAVADRNHECGFFEDSKQLSPVSVLDLPCDEGSPVHYHNQFCNRTTNEEYPSSTSFKLTQKITEESIFSGSFWDVLVQTLKEEHGFQDSEMQELLGSDSSSQYLKSKKVLQQTRQLLFDNVREVVESYEFNTRGSLKRFQPWRAKEFWGAEQLAKTICEQICSWVSTGDDITNTTQLLDSSPTKEGHEWRDFEPEVREIGTEIEGAIFAEIQREIVQEMVEESLCKRYPFL
ncbi:hypothetical protein AMTRI_Chr12g238840 [Amborella trichopoda]